MNRALVIVVTPVLLLHSYVFAQLSSGPGKGTLVVDGGGGTEAVKRRFIELAGGPNARIVVFPTGASAIRFGPEKTVLNPDWPRERKEWAAYEEYLQAEFGTERVTVLHTRDHAVANSAAFIEPVESATAVFLSTGNAGRIANAYLGTRTEKALRALLGRGGVIYGVSAGSIIMGSFIVRGRPDKPLLTPKGHTKGFGFLRNVAIDPHLTQAKRDAELVNVTDAHPKILGIGIDEDAALIVRGNCFEVIGSGQVAVYDNQPHPGAWYYWLKPGERFDLATWQKSSCPLSGLPTSQAAVSDERDHDWGGRRVVTLEGFGDYFVAGDDGKPKLIKPDGLGVNIVAVVQGIDGDHVWIKGNGAGDRAVGWVNKSNALLLEDAIPYFTSRIKHHSDDWDAYLRRAESEHAQNLRDAAISDYTRAIELHPNEAFLYLRRGRSLRTMKACPQAAADFEKAAQLKPAWAEAYNMAAAVYADCPDSQYRNPEKAIALIEHAVALDVEHPTYLTVLALSYFRSGQLEKAAVTQRLALESPHFPPGYREEATEQLAEYERALATQKRAQH